MNLRSYLLQLNCALVFCLVGILVLHSNLEASPLLIKEFYEAGINFSLYENGKTEYQFDIEYASIIDDPKNKDKLKLLSLDNPARLVVDIPNKNFTRNQTHKLTHKLFSAIRLGFHKNITRVVLDIKNGATPLHKEIQKINRTTYAIRFSILQKTASKPKKAFLAKENPLTKHQQPKPLSSSSARIKAPLHASAVKPSLSTKDSKLVSKAPQTLTKPIVSTARVKAPLHAKAVRPDLNPQDKPLVSKRPQTLKEPIKSSARVKAPLHAKAVAPSSGAQDHSSITKTPQTLRETTNRIVAELPITPKVSQAKKLKPQVLSKKKLSKAYTVKNEKIALVNVKKKTSYSRTPLNPSAHYNSVEKSLPSLVRYSRQKSKVGESELVNNEEQFESIVETQRSGTASGSLKQANSELLNHQMQIAQLQEQLNELDYKYESNSTYNPNNYDTLYLVLILLASALLIAGIIRRDLVVRLYQNLLLRKRVEKDENWQLLLEHYDILGCKETDSDHEIKARYRHLAKTFHTDKLHSQDLPEEVIALTNDQFRRIQEAYEAVRSIRDFT